jgi:hypothetical protein
VDSVDQVPVGLFHVLKADIAQNAGVVDKDIDTAKGVNGRLDNGLTILDRVVVGNSFAACAADLVDDLVCGLLSPSQSFPYCVCGREAVSDVRHTAEPLPSPLKLLPRSFTTTLAPRLP